MWLGGAGDGAYGEGGVSGVVAGNGAAVVDGRGDGLWSGGGAIREFCDARGGRTDRTGACPVKGADVVDLDPRGRVLGEVGGVSDGPGGDGVEAPSPGELCA